MFLMLSNLLFHNNCLKLFLHTTTYVTDKIKIIFNVLIL